MSSDLEGGRDVGYPHYVPLNMAPDVDGIGPAASVCRCALDKTRRFHTGSCPVAPGQPLRVTGAELLDGIEPWHTGVELDETRIGLLLAGGWHVAGIRLGSYIRLAPAGGAGPPVLIPLDRAAPDYADAMHAAVGRLRQIVATGAATAPALAAREPRAGAFVSAMITRREQRARPRMPASSVRLAAAAVSAAQDVRSLLGTARRSGTGRDEIIAGLARLHALVEAHLIAGGGWTEDPRPPRDVIDAWALTLRINLTGLRELTTEITSGDQP